MPLREQARLANDDIIQRLRQSFADFRSQRIDIAELKGLILALGNALEGFGNIWQDLVNQVEGRLEMIRFTVASELQFDEAVKQIQRLEAALAAGPYNDR